jgi:hypothetical protein
LTPSRAYRLARAENLLASSSLGTFLSTIDKIVLII